MRSTFTKDQLLQYLAETGEILRSQGLEATVYVVGGAAISLVHDARRTTRDVDAWIRNEQDAVLRASAEVAARHGLPDDWLNTKASAFLSRELDSNAQEINLPGLTVLLASAEHLIAMKLRAGRDRDVDDLIFLFEVAGVETPEQAAAIHDRLFDDTDIGYLNPSESLYEARRVFQVAQARAARTDNDLP